MMSLDRARDILQNEINSRAAVEEFRAALDLILEGQGKAAAVQNLIEERTAEAERAAARVASVTQQLATLDSAYAAKVRLLDASFAAKGEALQAQHEQVKAEVATAVADIHAKADQSVADRNAQLEELDDQLQQKRAQHTMLTQAIADAKAFLQKLHTTAGSPA